MVLPLCVIGQLLLEAGFRLSAAVSWFEW